MFSLRNKTILSLILMSFVSIALTAISARILISQRFDELAKDPVAEGFMTEVIAYYDEYGSWEAALEAEPLFSFASRLRATGELPPPVFYPENQTPFVFLRGPGGIETGMGPPPFNDGEVPVPGPPPPEGQEFFPPEPPPPPPPYLVLDETGRVILSPMPSDVGQQIRGLQLGGAIPIPYQGNVIGYLYSDLRAALSDQEEQYLSAIKDSWWIALLVIAALTIPIGVIFGKKIAGPIDSLDRAMRAMQPGALKQNVPVKSNDELGLLSASFNQMSKDLSDAYDELEKSRKKMEEMSLQDPLTLLPNRRAFNESASIVIAQAYRHGRSCVLAMIDVDRFKDINDFYSHATGDRVLQLLGDVLRSNLREVDILARYGGEEFMVLFPETDLASAHKLMERLRIFISEHVWSDMEPEFRVTVSAGLVEVDVNELSAEPLDIAINAADKKLYKAKDNGRNRTES